MSRVEVPRYRLVLPVPDPIDPSQVRGRGLMQYVDPETGQHGGWYHLRADGSAVTQDGQLIVWSGAFEAADHCHIGQPVNVRGARP